MSAARPRASTISLMTSPRPESHERDVTPVSVRIVAIATHAVESGFSRIFSDRIADLRLGKNPAKAGFHELAPASTRGHPHEDRVQSRPGPPPQHPGGGCRSLRP